MQTEYQRRDIEPSTAGRSLLHDKNGIPLVAKNSQKRMPAPPEIPNEPIRVTARNQAQGDASPVHNVPPQPMAHVGMHEDTMWFDEELVAGEAPSDGKMIDNNEEMDVESLQRPDPERDAELKRSSPDLTDRRSWMDRMDQSGNTLDFEPEGSGVEEIEILGFLLEKGEYAVLLDSQLLIKHDNVEYVKRVIEDMVFNQNIEVSSISVVRSLPIDFGILIKE